MAIDLGLDNLTTITFKDNVKTYIIDGKYAKSKNSYYNKEIVRLTSIAMEQCKNCICQLKFRPFYNRKPCH